MHIPSAESTALAILSFEEAQKRTSDADYDRARWLYVPDFYADYRYVLGTRGAKPLIAVGVNPSTAAPGALDNTLKSVERIAHANGFDSFLMFNVYAQRATRPEDMDTVFNARLHEENLKALRFLLTQAGEKPVIWAAWGAVIEKRDYLPQCVADLYEVSRESNTRWVHAGSVSKNGHPHHPLYLKKDTPLADFDIVSYVNMLRLRK